MEIRRITKQEYKRAQELFYLAFEFAAEEGSLDAEQIEKDFNQPQTREEQYPTHKWAAFNEQGKMMGCIGASPTNIRFDGHEVLCSCIGGVSTLPQYRGRGAITACFQKQLEDSYEEGYSFSYLYPFSTAFYRQYGYEIGYESVTWEIDITALPYDKTLKGTAELNEEGSHFKEIDAVYQCFAKDCNLSFVREACDWSKIIYDQPVYQNKYTYVWRNQEGKAKGVVCFSKERGEEVMTTWMVCEAFYFSDEEGLKGLLGFMRSFSNNFGRVRIRLPKHIHLEHYLPETSLKYFSKQHSYFGMARVVNVEKVLDMAKYRGTGTVSIKITDKQLAANNRIFKVSFQEGRCVKIEDAQEAMIELPIHTFSRWILGCCDYDDYETSELAAVFYPKKTYIGDSF